MSHVIGLTGGIGSGKSTVTNLLEKQGVKIIDTDIIARNLVQPSSAALTKISDKFGSDILNNDGSLNRAKLRQIIFNNEQKKRQLEEILHPLIQQNVRQQIAENQKTFSIIVVAIPLLVEAIIKGKRPDYLDKIWVVDCSVELQIARATVRDQNTEAQIKQIIKAQATRAQRLEQADNVIDNSGSISQLEAQIKQLLTQA